MQDNMRLFHDLTIIENKNRSCLNSESEVKKVILNYFLEEIILTVISIYI